MAATTPDLAIRSFCEQDGEAYAALFKARDENLLYASPAYLSYLKALLDGAEDRTLMAFRDSALVGILPCLVHPHAEHGAVMNSLPYYGSNAGILLAPGEGMDVASALLTAWKGLAEELDAAAWTLVENPLSPMAGYMERLGLHSLEDDRVGQLTPLSAIRPGHAAEELMGLFHSKTRNMIRKFENTGLTIDRDESLGALHDLYALHCENMQDIGGRAKPEEAFTRIPDHFEAGSEYRLYTVRDKGTLAAALLVFFCNRTAEYYTPAVRVAYRSYQPISGMAYRAMQDAVAMGMFWWNWGGTWLSQDGVYRFKSRWGTQNVPYRYYIDVRNSDIMWMSPEALREAYPYFYVRPYNTDADTTLVTTVRDQ